MGFVYKDVHRIEGDWMDIFYGMFIGFMTNNVRSENLAVSETGEIFITEISRSCGDSMVGKSQFVVIQWW